MNGVLQVRQSRHRRMTRTMLDLTRLCWNCRPLRYSSRRKFCPYQALDLDLPTCDFWTLLHSNPDELTQTLSTA
jgi:hypothetical protein